MSQTGTTNKEIIGTVYLIHFSEPFKHARHYLGFTSRYLSARINDHRKGGPHAAKLLQKVAAAGITWEVVRTWENVPKIKEKRLKHKQRLNCPKCLPHTYRGAKRGHKRINSKSRI